MTSERSGVDDPADGESTIRRRRMLRAAGAVGASSVAIATTAGTAAAGETPDQLYWCGCSQVVVTGLSDGQTVTVYLRADEDGGCETKTIGPDCEVGGGREYAYRYEVSDEEAILAIRAPDRNLWCNPNTCAQKWLGECVDTRRCRDASDLDPPAEVYTRACGTVCSDGGPPAGNGPPGGNGPP